MIRCNTILIKCITIIVALSVFSSAYASSCISHHHEVETEIRLEAFTQSRKLVAAPQDKAVLQTEKKSIRSNTFDQPKSYNSFVLIAKRHVLAQAFLL